MGNTQRKVNPVENDYFKIEEKKQKHPTVSNSIHVAEYYNQQKSVYYKNQSRLKIESLKINSII